MNRTVLTSFTILCVLSTVFLSGLTFEIQPVKAASGTIYIRADGSIDPPTANITKLDNITYTFTGSIYDEIGVERDNTVVDGAGHTVEGTDASDSIGIDLTGRSNVTIENMQIKRFGYGVMLSNSSSNTLSGNNITENFYDGIVLTNSSRNVISSNIGLNDAIHLENSSNNTIRGNILMNSGCGLYVLDSYQNIVENNTVNGKPLVYLENASGCKIADAGQVVLVRCNNIVVENMDLSNADIGIELWETSNCVIANNTLNSNLWNGISVFEGSANNTITDNIISYNHRGLCLSGSSNNTIKNNNIVQNFFSIEISSDNVFFHNNLIDNIQRAGASLWGWNTWDDGYPSGGNYWSDHAVTDNYSGPFQNETGSDGIGDAPYTIDTNNQDNYPLMSPWVAFEGQTIYIRADGSIDPSGAPVQRKGDLYMLTGNVTSDSDGIVIERDNMTLNGTGFTIQGPESGYEIGLDLSYRSEVTVENMTISGFTTTGIYLWHSSSINLLENIVRNIHSHDPHSFGPGIAIGESTDILVSGNVVTNNDVGLNVGDCNNTLSNNTITENDHFGILFCGSGNTFSDNVVRYNGEYGITLQSSASRNTIFDNTIANNHAVGVDLYISSHNTIFSNVVRDNYYGIRLSQSSDNKIYHNDFVNNIVNAYSYQINVWDDGYPSGGNYWSDYNGTDLHSGPYQNETGYDWTGDSPYIVDQNNTDRYPLMYPFVPELEEMRIAYRTLLMEFNTLNASYQQHLLDYSKLQENYTSFQNSYNNIQASLNSLNSTCNDLLSSYQTLNSSYNNLNTAFNDYKTSTQSELDNTRNLVYVLTAITVILIVAIVYLAVRKPKTKPET